MEKRLHLHLLREHRAGKHRIWMKMHVAADETTQQIQAVTLTTNAVDDATEVSALLQQIPQKVGIFKGDGVYNKRKVRKELYERNIQQVIPPQHNAVVSRAEPLHLQHRDKAIQTIATIGRAERKKRKIITNIVNQKQPCSDTRRLLGILYLQER